MQQKILKHLLECNNEDIESVSHIARTLHVHQPAAHRSVNALMKEEYLVKEKKYAQRAKGVTLTSKNILLEHSEVYAIEREMHKSTSK